VSSPVTNINLPNAAFIEAVQAAFAQMYHASHDAPPIELGDDFFDHEEIRKGYDELVVSFIPAYSTFLLFRCLIWKYRSHC
jgi:hypothetical protein